MHEYFSERRGRRERFSIEGLREQMVGLWQTLLGNNMLSEWAGYRCVDGRAEDPSGVHGAWMPGTGGANLAASMYAATRRRDLFPVRPVEDAWAEDRIFDLLEFIGTVVSKATDRRFHDYFKCGYHPTHFERETGITEYLDQVNQMLAGYSTGWQMGRDLKIVERVPDGLEELVTAPLAPGLGDEQRRRVEVAVTKFRQRGATR